MKTVVLSIAVLAVALTGCITKPPVINPDGTVTPGTKTPDIARIAAVTEEVVRIGTATILIDRPDLLPHFQTALAELTLIEKSKTVTPALLIDILNQLPVKQLHGNNSAMIFESARVLLIASGWSQIDITRTAQLLPIVTAMKQGLITAGVEPLGQPVPVDPPTSDITIDPAAVIVVEEPLDPTIQ